MSWQSDRAGEREIARDHRHEYRVPVFALVALLAAAAIVVVRFLYLAIPA